MIKFFVTYIVPGSGFFPIILFLINRRTAGPALKALFIYLLAAVAVNITAIILAMNGIRNLWLLHLYTVMETVLLLYFFICLNHGRIAKTILWILLITFPLACIINWLFFQGASNFNTYTRSIESVLIIGAAASYWLGSSKENLDIAWTDNPVNWMISGLLLYFAGALFLFLFSNYLEIVHKAKPDDPVYYIIWLIHGCFVVIMYILFGIGFIKSKNGR